MPDPLADQANGNPGEPDPYLARLAALEHGKASVQHFGQGEVLRPAEFSTRASDLPDARQSKGAYGATPCIVPEQIPLVLDATEMIRLHHTSLRLFTGQLVVTELDFGPLHDRFGQRIENLHVCQPGAAAPHRQRLFQFVPSDLHFAAERMTQLPERRGERTLEGCAAELLERLLGQQQCGDFALRNLHDRKIPHRRGVVEPVSHRVVVQGQPETVPHELDIAHHRFRGNLQINRQSLAVRIISGSNPLVDAPHTFHGRTCDALGRR